MKKNLITLGLGLLLVAIPMQLSTATLNIAAITALPFNDQCQYARYNGELWPATTTTWRTYYAPVYLPNDARIKALTLFYRDNVAGYIEFKLIRRNTYTGAIQTIVSHQSTVNTSVDQIIKVTSVNWAINKINNSGYTYYLEIFFSEAGGLSSSFNGAKVLY